MAVPWRSSGRMDADVRGYCDRTGATASTAINNFARGLKGMGMWENFACFLMPQTQSIGSGSFLPCFGGSGAGITGTLINGPTWGLQGITFPFSSYIDVSGANSLFRNKGAGWVCAVYSDGDPSGGDSGRSVVWFSTGINTAVRLALWSRRNMTYSVGLSRRLDTEGVVESSSGTAPGTGFHYHDCVAQWSANTLASRIDGAANPVGAFSSAGVTADIASASVRIGSSAPGANRFSGIISMIAFSDRAVTLATSEAFRSLYKSTVGRELGLP
ncbi:hypothetical protein TSACC_2902 [Terrimicrobium sacchariphilum]|uniref:Concanavalin A-like lectin/glucanases superfamily protein n=1 Tax=Terrimicrobium sacchariphilum TaxID=690879 RepID=A0A146G506_TERSA|nr:hypothetical protein TSACC_2902 [Terrimicrobium sacchariphilum]